ncbi:hypothetical protein BGZ57DRAFT_894252 [Hyaloscypha finlandica]|nr:hypothetical protein BGZ57DRAFT_894252 [Hyaloscypha finlandica]
MPLGLSKFKDSLKGEKLNGNGTSPDQQQENVAPVPVAAAAAANINGNGDSPDNNEALPTYAPIDGPTAEALSAAFSSLRLSDTPPAFPDTNTCLAHLKLLSAFHALKEDIGYTDGLFNLWDAKCELLGNRDESLAKMREKRWVLFIARAVERFEDWWLNVLCYGEEARRLEGKAMVATSLKFMEFTKRGRVQKWTTSMLPPIDVLMVWHAFMLNPRNYLEDCVRFGLKDLWATGLPWPAVNAAIDTSFNYEVPDEGKKAWTAKTGRHWTNAQDSLVKNLQCPRCNQQLEIPWTTCSQGEKPSMSELQEMTGTGYGDRDLSYICHKCGGEINQDLLRVAKFKKDSENLILRDWPLGGTILSTTTGGPDGPIASEAFTHFNTFPNRLISMALRSKVLELTNPNCYRKPTMLDVRDLIENSIKDKNIVKKVNSKSTFESCALRRQERLAVRKMMSRYWENSSVFALELGGAVIRQSVFVDKMYSLDWLHSPAAKETMKRLLLKYQRFIQIMATYPLHVAVPTLDVDLGWHTHQLSPRPYYDYTVEKCKKFIDHDDKMDEDQLNTSFEWTSKTYQKLFQGVYSECTCWYCEAIRSKHISSAGRLFGTSTHEKVADKFYDSGAAKLCPPDNSAHISAHSAVKALESSTRARVYDAMRARRQQELDTAYDKACRRARNKGRPVPSRDAYYYGPWGYPYMMYGPWMAYGYYPGIYAYGDPYCMPMGAGMAGACAAGTCSGGVAAGGCGGAGGCGTGGGCSGGGMGGGCGGSGGCGGGGGGGGGCGGGGGGG